MVAKKVRTRFAPSPTGYMHVGNLRTALYAYLIAKHEGGDFLLRIEDTDQERLVSGAVDVIYNTLKQTGLIHDEGPDIGGPVGPYVQSERKDIYLEYAKKLVDAGEAYYCFCSKERLDNLREDAESKKETPKYDKHCLNLSEEEIKENLKNNVPYVIRQNNPTKGTTSFDDVIYGNISFDNSELDDMILIKSDGFPTYNFANVVDDHLMSITHIVRGCEYLSSTPKYNRLYEAFGWEIPTYVHCPLITNEEHVKLSKRNGDASFQDLIEKGFLKEAVLNFIALLGWNSGTNKEIFSLDELVEAFDYKHINKAPSVFDRQKLKWMNSQYIKNLDLDVFHEMALPYIKNIVKSDLDTKKIAELVQGRIETFPEIESHIDFFEELPDYSLDIYVHKKMKTTLENSLENLTKVLPHLKTLDNWTVDSIHETVFALIAELEIKNGQMLWPIRTALSGKQMTPGGAFELADILGKEESLKRIEKGIELLTAELNK